MPVDVVADTVEEFKQRIIRFMQPASAEITPADLKFLPELTKTLPLGNAVYVAHTPAAGLEDIVRTSLAVQQAGFAATPHIVGRRIPSALMLYKALQDLRAGGVDHLLLVAGDTEAPTGEFSSALDVLRSGVLEASGIWSIGVAGHPEGHPKVAASVLWDALEVKQSFAARCGMRMHVVTQFGFDARAVCRWQQQLASHNIRLPVHVGIAGPTPLTKLFRFALQCGIGASLRTVMRNANTVRTATDLAITPGQHLLRLLESAPNAQLVAPHFFAFGGTLQTARWIAQMARGQFELISADGQFGLRT